MSKRKKSRSRLWPIVLILIIAASALVGVSVAKYIQTTTFTGTLKFNAKLAESVEMLEHQAERQSDGSYTLINTENDPETEKNEEITVSKNEYVLIPGLDIPKDPFVRITGKTSIEAYLYVEVVENIDSIKDETSNTEEKVITWIMDEDWLLLSEVTGKHGAVYVYAPDGTPKALGINDSGDYPLLEGNKVYVSQKLLRADIPEETSLTGDLLTFYAALGEVNVSDKTDAVAHAKEVYEQLIFRKAT